jgi:hypothetical protein
MIKASLDGTADDIIASMYQLGLNKQAEDVDALRTHTLQTLLDVETFAKCLFSTLQDVTKDRKLFAQKVNISINSKYRGVMFMMLDDRDTQPKLHELTFDYVYTYYKPN